MFNEDNARQKVSEEDLLDFVKNIHTVGDLRTAKIRNSTYKIVLSTMLWKEYDDFLNIKPDDWQELKYFDANGEKNKQLNSIPNDKGGIYIYLVKPPIPIRYIDTILYVGRARSNGETQNLRKRINHYNTEKNDYINGRPTIRTIFNEYSDYLYVMYYPLDDNDKIDKLESELISAIAPTANKDLKQKALKDGRDSF